MSKEEIMESKYGSRLIALTLILTIGCISMPRLYAAEFSYNKMNLGNYVSSRILNLDNWGSSVYDRQANSIMKNGFLVPGKDSYGYFRITLSSQYIGRGKKDTGLTITSVIAGSLTFGLTLLVIPIGEIRYNLTASIEFFDHNKNRIAQYDSSTMFDGLEKMVNEDYTWKTEVLYRNLLKNCLTAASRDADKINNALINAKYPPPPPVEEVVKNAFNALSAKIPDGARIAVIGIDPKKDDFLITRQIESRLFNASRFRVLERARIDAIIAEGAFSRSVFVNVNDAIEVGRILSAHYIVLGDVSGKEANKTLGFRVVSVLTGELIASFTGSFRAN
jgi:hypothetical protein